MKANLLPQGTFGFPFLPHGIEQGTAELLDLVDQECQHNQVNKYFAQMLLAQPVVVTKIIPLILQGVERLILSGKGLARYHMARLQPLPIRTAREVFPQAAHPMRFF